MDLDSISELVTISYNSDVKVKEFVDELKQRIVAFNWKTKNKMNNIMQNIT